MCGIVAAIATKNIVPVLLEGLRKLEYRGYDSAGLAVLEPRLTRLRSVGRVSELAARAAGLTSTIGIAHTRWATHGAPSKRNVHPHISGRLAVVHNGIIENFDEIRQRLMAEGYVFTSDTDTESIIHLIKHTLKRVPDLFEAVREVTGQLIGAYAIAVLCEGEGHAGRIILARHGAPLLLGIGSDGLYAASDAMALLQVTRNMVYLEDGDIAEISQGGLRITGADGAPVERSQHESALADDAVELGQFRHFMQKEIFEQPAALANTLEILGGGDAGLGFSPNLFGAAAPELLKDVKSILILACRTSYHAGMVARYWIEHMACIPCAVEIASEYRYRKSVPNRDVLVVVISQPGETADTLAAVKHARALGMRTHACDLQCCRVRHDA